MRTSVFSKSCNGGAILRIFAQHQVPWKKAKCLGWCLLLYTLYWVNSRYSSWCLGRWKSYCFGPLPCSSILWQFFECTSWTKLIRSSTVFCLFIGFNTIILYYEFAWRRGQILSQSTTTLTSQSDRQPFALCMDLRSLTRQSRFAAPCKHRSRIQPFPILWHRAHRLHSSEYLYKIALDDLPHWQNFQGCHCMVSLCSRIFWQETSKGRNVSISSPSPPKEYRCVRLRSFPTIQVRWSGIWSPSCSTSSRYALAANRCWPCRSLKNLNRYR